MEITCQEIQGVRKEEIENGKKEIGVNVRNGGTLVYLSRLWTDFVHLTDEDFSRPVDCLSSTDLATVYTPPASHSR